MVRRNKDLINTADKEAGKDLLSRLRAVDSFTRSCNHSYAYVVSAHAEGTLSREELFEQVCTLLYYYCIS